MWYIRTTGANPTRGCSHPSIPKINRHLNSRVHCKGCGRRRLSATDGYGFDGREPRTRAVPVGMARQKPPGRADDVGAGRRNADPRPADRRGQPALRRGRVGTDALAELSECASPEIKLRQCERPRRGRELPPTRRSHRRSSASRCADRRRAGDRSPARSAPRPAPFPKDRKDRRQSGQRQITHWSGYGGAVAIWALTTGWALWGAMMVKR
jgi:hypothetical protein